MLDLKDNAGCKTMDRTYYYWLKMLRCEEAGMAGL